MVQGHVEGTGTIMSFRREGESLWVTVAAEPAVLRSIVPKGFVAIDGASLTVCDVNRAAGWFNFMLVPITQKKVSLMMAHTVQHEF